MVIVSCKHCEREFNDTDALYMHHQAKHPGETPQKRYLSSKTKKRIKIWIATIIVLSLLVTGSLALFKQKNSSTINEENLNIPSAPIHWHPQLTIRINGQEQLIPVNIGLGGNVHQPIHTHETDGTIHMENNKPTLSTVTLGSFFKIWGKKFNKECIFEYCTDKGNITMYVNGQKNEQFGDYIMRDKDKILIDYVSTK